MHIMHRVSSNRGPVARLPYNLSQDKVSLGGHDGVKALTPPGNTRLVRVVSRQIGLHIAINFYVNWHDGTTNYRRLCDAV